MLFWYLGVCKFTHKSGIVSLQCYLLVLALMIQPFIIPYCNKFGKGCVLDLWPPSYNMVGHLKFCLTILGGFLLFADPLQPIQLGGILLTFSGSAS